MQFQETRLPGAFLIRLQPHADERGHFVRTWCREEFSRRGLHGDFVQCNASYNRMKGTVRGLHYQEPPHQEAKLIRVVRGAIHDVAVDLRRDSPTYLQWMGVDLSQENQTMLYLPEGMAHGFQTLEDETEVLYQMSTYHEAAAARGLRWDDPILGVRWPLAPTLISDRDRCLPLVGFSAISS